MIFAAYICMYLFIVKKMYSNRFVAEFSRCIWKQNLNIIASYEDVVVILRSCPCLCTHLLLLYDRETSTELYGIITCYFQIFNYNRWILHGHLLCITLSWLLYSLYIYIYNIYIYTYTITLVKELCCINRSVLFITRQCRIANSAFGKIWTLRLQFSCFLTISFWNKRVIKLICSIIAGSWNQ